MSKIMPELLVVEEGLVMRPLPQIDPAEFVEVSMENIDALASFGESYQAETFEERELARSALLSQFKYKNRYQDMGIIREYGIQAEGRLIGIAGVTFGNGQAIKAHHTGEIPGGIDGVPYTYANAALAHYWMDHNWQNKNVTTPSVETMVDHVFDEYNISTAFFRIHANNTASQSVASRLNAQPILEDASGDMQLWEKKRAA